MAQVSRGCFDINTHAISASRGGRVTCSGDSVHLGTIRGATAVTALLPDAIARRHVMWPSCTCICLHHQGVFFPQSTGVQHPQRWHPGVPVQLPRHAGGPAAAHHRLQEARALLICSAADSGRAAAHCCRARQLPRHHHHQRVGGGQAPTMLVTLRRCLHVPVKVGEGGKLWGGCSGGPALWRAECQAIGDLDRSGGGQYGAAGQVIWGEAPPCSLHD